MLSFSYDVSMDEYGLPDIKPETVKGNEETQRKTSDDIYYKQPVHMYVIVDKPAFEKSTDYQCCIEVNYHINGVFAIFDYQWQIAINT